ncbi:hypothetical protein ACWGOK_31790 [Streptomyces eurythermus]
MSVAESPFVVARDERYYLFIGPRGGYDGTNVLASRDPFHFDLDGHAGHVPGHAVEPVTDGEQWYVALSSSSDVACRRVWEAPCSTGGDVDEFRRHRGSCQGSIRVLLVKGAGHAADVEGRAVRGDPA